VKDISAIVKGDLVGIDHVQGIKSLARVTRVNADEVHLWVINGCYEITFNRQTGFTEDYGSQARIVMLDDIAGATLLVVLDLEEKSRELSLDDVKEYQSKHTELLHDLLSFEHDETLQEASDWKPKQGSFREGDILWRHAKRAQLESKKQALENEATELGLHLR
jgi:hypothetical protein